jgi:hypothetical protein
MNLQAYKRCIDACLDCATACRNCVSESLREYDVRTLTQCIELARECEVVCTATAALMSTGSENALLLCNPCAIICGECAAECEQNTAFQHCRVCAEECRKCAEECLEMIEVPIGK